MALPRGYRNEAAKEPKALPAKGFLRMASVISVRFASETYEIRMNLLNKVHFCILSSRKALSIKANDQDPGAAAQQPAPKSVQYQDPIGKTETNGY